MSETYSPPAAYSPPLPPRGTVADLRVAGVVAVALSLLGALLGLLWALWSPPGSAAEVLGGGVFQVIDETENHVAGDGRFLVIVTTVGIVAALLAWFLRPANRGPVVLLGLAVGAIAGALLTELVGHLSGGGSFSGKIYRLGDGTRQEVTLHLPLSLHMPGLLFVEPALVALVYGLFVAFAVHDDLGRPDPVRDALRPAEVDTAVGGHAPAEQQQWPPAQQQWPPPGSVDAGDHPQYGGGHGDAAGPLQQGDLPPQQPGHPL